MSHRTTLILDEEARQAARELAFRYGCSVSEAIRRAVVHHRDTLLGVPAKTRSARKQALERLFTLFEGNDPDDEIRRLKEQDDGF